MKKQHWAQQRERGSYWLMRLTMGLNRLLGRRLLSPLLYLIVLYFFVFGGKARKSIWEYQQHLAQWSGRDDLRPSRRRVFRQFMSFADSLLDKLDVWNGKMSLTRMSLDDPAHLCRTLYQEGRGQILVAAHLGNLEVCRALAEVGEQVTINVLVHTKHAEQFNRLLGEAGATHLRLIQVSELDAAVMLQLSERLACGEWLAIAGDRVPLKEGRRARVNFLGQPADFPQGPWLLAGLLQCPVNLIYCLKTDSRYQVFIEAFAERLQWKRSEREQVIQLCAQRYADSLAQRCLSAPLQWFNFYPFWNKDDNKAA
ncbi:glycosyl transferase [Pseudomonas sp. 5P_3.1_Bac2]|uniref:LpxL/LpxP family acyltransferase n=1 Tax=Pseudomonas sp. 5P_3.1_Bac2 TaxID=2971617 RepID=UPI0021CA6970|nr:glycosyl transferase [Pseudomonas sp. 5P_3.1_Bac2]MCU1718377.1 glycosyl transferase [Pseudomonas sp. 5P_3.1_Bac2]